MQTAYLLKIKFIILIEVMYNIIHEILKKLKKYIINYIINTWFIYYTVSGI